MPRWETPSKRWERHEVEFVRAHYLAMSHAQMAAALGRTAGQVKSFCARRGLVNRDRQWTEAEKQIVRDGTGAGLTARQIAAQIPGASNRMSLDHVTPTKSQTVVDALRAAAEAFGGDDDDAGEVDPDLIDQTQAHGEIPTDDMP